MCPRVGIDVVAVGHTSAQGAPMDASAEIKPMTTPRAAQLAACLHGDQPLGTHADPYVLTAANVADILALVDNKQCFQQYFHQSTCAQYPSWNRRDVVCILVAVLYSQSAAGKANACQHKLPQKPLGAQKPAWWTGLTDAFCHVVDRETNT